MAKPTTELKLKKEYKARGYVVENKLYVCPTCSARFAELKGKDARTKLHGLWKAFAVCVLLFHKEGYPSIAACPKCGLRRSSKHQTHQPTPEDNGKCKGATVKGKRCKLNAQSNGYCTVHQDQANVVERPTNV